MLLSYTMRISCIILFCAALVASAPSSDPPPDLGDMANLVKKLMGSVRDDLCPSCMNSCIARSKPPHYVWGNLFTFPRLYRASDCPYLCSERLKIAMGGEIHAFIRGYELGLPNTHPLTQRIKENKAYAFNRIPFFQCAGDDWKSQQRIIDSPDPTPRIDWDELWKTFRQEHGQNGGSPSTEQTPEDDSPDGPPPPSFSSTTLTAKSPSENACTAATTSKMSKHLNWIHRACQATTKLFPSAGFFKTDTKGEGEGERGEGRRNRVNHALTLLAKSLPKSAPVVRTNPVFPIP